MNFTNSNKSTNATNFTNSTNSINVGRRSTIHDAGGFRVAERVNDVWRFSIYDIGGKCVAEYGGPPSNDDGGVKYVLQDWQGSTRAVLNNAGFVNARTDYTAFGETIGSDVGLRTSSQGFGASDTLRQKYAFTTRDDATGLDHTWFRKNEPQAGRWTSPDPYNGSMNLGDPQSFNRYSYVVHDPVNFVDPTGLYEACVHEAMTKFIGRLANLAPSVADKIAGYTGDGEGGADSFAFMATNPANIATCSLGAGPSVTVHFPSAAQLRANIRNYSHYLALGLGGNEAYYQLAGFALHSIEDAMGAHRGYSNRLCKGHVRHGVAPDRMIGDRKFINAANKVFQVMSNNQNAKLSAAQIKALIAAIIVSCNAKQMQITQPPASGGFGGFVGWDGNAANGYSTLMYTQDFLNWLYSIPIDVESDTYLA